jgi:hypothetical protein
MKCVVTLSCMLAANLVSAEPLQLYFHVPTEDGETLNVAMTVGFRLMEEGYEVVDVRPVPVEMRQTTVRYFKPELRVEALRAKELLERVLRENGIEEGTVRLQDFTFYRPTPTMYSLEVWFKPEHRNEAARPPARSDPLAQR